MSKLQKIKKLLEEDDIDEMKEVFDFICNNYHLKSDKTKEGYETRHFKPEEKANYIYRQLPVIYYEKSMIYILMEQIYYSRNNLITNANKIKKLKKQNEELQLQIDTLKYQIEELEKLKHKDILKIIQERDYYKKKWNDFKYYGIK